MLADSKYDTALYLLIDSIENDTLEKNGEKLIEILLKEQIDHIQI